ncbi:phage tail tip lysozyme [Kribbella sp. NPDC026611]|uniref:phage tail tip lysozyme n=1 Tax=Kribbella sp. NPDC026611 TaxID=3154911 RepID=UPI0033D64CA8
MANKIWGIIMIPFVMIFALVIVIAMLLSALSGTADAQSCQPVTTESKSFSYPTDSHDLDEGWQDPDENGYSHSGLDWKVKEGSKVYAIQDGKVVSIDNNTVVINHGEALQTHTQFFHDIMVKPGDEVKRGQQIGTSGSGDEAAPGDSGEHVHLEMWLDKEGKGNYQNEKPHDEDIFGDPGTPAGATGGGCGGCGGGTGPLTGANNEQKAFNFFVTSGYTKEQAAGITGNLVAESSVEPLLMNPDLPGTNTPTAQAASSDKAWGIAQWHPPSEFIKNARGTGADDQTIGTLEFQLKWLKEQLDGKGPMPKKEVGDHVKAAKTVEDAAYIFGFEFEKFSTDPNSPELKHRQADARTTFDKYAGQAPAAGGACTGDPKGIVKTALLLAWDTEKNSHEPKPANYHNDGGPGYAAANAQYNKGNSDLTDCGVFVATVMHMSGADKDYPGVSTRTQLPYLRSSGKYDVYDNLNDEHDLHPGDIFIINRPDGSGHTYIYTGPYTGGDNAKYNAASASLGGHTPQAEHMFFSDYGGHYVVARLKQ